MLVNLTPGETGDIYSLCNQTHQNAPIIFIWFLFSERKLNLLRENNSSLKLSIPTEIFEIDHLMALNRPLFDIS